MTCQGQQRLTDTQAAIDAIRSHLRRGGDTDHLAHRYFDTAHDIVQATVDHRHR